MAVPVALGETDPTGRVESDQRALERPANPRVSSPCFAVHET